MLGNLMRKSPVARARVKLHRQESRCLPAGATIGWRCPYGWQKLPCVFITSTLNINAQHDSMMLHLITFSHAAGEAAGLVAAAAAGAKIGQTQQAAEDATQVAGWLVGSSLICGPDMISDIAIAERIHLQAPFTL